MDQPKQTKTQASDETGQQLVGFLTNEEWDELVGRVGALLAEVESIPYPGVKEKVFALLQAIDSIHREPLRRLVHVFKEGVLEKVVTDPAIHTLMELYDLLPKESVREAQPSEEVWKSRLTQMTPGKTAKLPPPHWVPALRDCDALSAGQCTAVTLDDQDLLLCRINESFFALDLHCTQDGASLAQATLEGYTIVCPNHDGCYYDVRQGKRLGASGTLACYPTQTADDGRVLVGFGIPFAPNLPSF